MEEQNLIYINIVISCFVSIFYLSRKYIQKNKKNKYSDQIIQKINELEIGKFTIDNLIEEIKKIIPVKLDEEEIKNNDDIKKEDIKNDELLLNDVKIIISQEL